MKRLILIALALLISECAAPEVKNNAESYYRRGNAWCTKGDYDRAIANYSKAIELDERFAVAYGNRGSAYLGKSHYDRAISDYNKAIEINPKLAEAYYNRGLAYYLNGEYYKSYTDVLKARSLGYPVNPEILKALRKTLGG